MQELFASGHMVELIVVFTMFEGLCLWAYRVTTGRGLPMREFALNMVSGLFLMLALRQALLQQPWQTIAVFLAASGIAHGADLALRWQRSARIDTNPQHQPQL
jgi:multisubunit Na+/H+ antiporter MnhF subunit